MENKKMELLKSVVPKGADLIYAEYINTGKIFADNGTIYEGLPPFHRLRFAIHPSKKSNIRLEIWLPDQWNGRYIATGSGGIGGYIATYALADVIKGGYACANADIGTSGGIACGYQNTAVKTDYGWRATHLMATYGKKILKSFYGKKPSFSYFKGASTGGMQAYSEAQRYPKDFDGIYAEVPSILNVAFHTNYMWAWRHLHKEDKTALFTKEELALVANLAAVFFRKHHDGETDDVFVSYPYYGKSTISDFIKYLCTDAPQLTKKQLTNLQAIYEGPYDTKRGRRISCGMPIGSERYWASYCGESCPGIYPFLWVFGPSFNPWTFDFSDDFLFFERHIFRYIDAVSTDLTKFRDNGGKMLAFAGTGDPVVLYPELNLYYEKVCEFFGGTENTFPFFLYYLLPGRDHGNGLGADSISAMGKKAHGAFDVLVDWVENGKAPYRLDAVSHDNDTYKEKRPFERAIYPYGSQDFPFMPHPECYLDM